MRQWHRAQLGDERLSYLAALPFSYDFLLSGQQVRLFHASQVSVHHRVYETGTIEQHRAMFDNTALTGFDREPKIIGYGDLHTAFMRNVGGHTLFNAGSVGDPLDVPLACYAILEGVYGAEAPHPWALHFVRLQYDIESEIAEARASGMPDFAPYANELRTAIYRGSKPPLTSN